MFITPTAPTRARGRDDQADKDDNAMVLFEGADQRVQLVDGEIIRLRRTEIPDLPHLPDRLDSRSFTISWFGAFTAMFTSCRPCEPPKELS